MRFLIDMNLSPSWVSFLEKAGFKAVHWSSVGAADATDRVLMHRAGAHDDIVLTNDLDFSAILAAIQRRKPSVIQIRADLLSPTAIGGALLRAVAQTDRELADGAERGMRKSGFRFFAPIPLSILESISIDPGRRGCAFSPLDRGQHERLSFWTRPTIG